MVNDYTNEKYIQNIQYWILNIQNNEKYIMKNNFTCFIF